MDGTILVPDTMMIIIIAIIIIVIEEEEGEIITIIDVEGIEGIIVEITGIGIMIGGEVVEVGVVEEEIDPTGLVRQVLKLIQRKVSGLIRVMNVLIVFGNCFK